MVDAQSPHDLTPREIVAINLALREAVLDDFRTIPIINMLDDAGEETDDPREAVSFVAKAADDVFIVALVKSFETPTLN